METEVAAPEAALNECKKERASRVPESENISERANLVSLFIFYLSEE
ncbi:hypothetical protein G9409_00685 [Chlorobium sp. BLA1]|nr:hypothetical protein [Candidatus Chlorobium masyuteum]NHQ59115.1 hypothetical protein [Candidatus Chlorobium masyuteum]NTU44280.1 hypothetical protein [Chlorobiaceae bacterium]